MVVLSIAVTANTARKFTGLQANGIRLCRRVQQMPRHRQSRESSQPAKFSTGKNALPRSQKPTHKSWRHGVACLLKLSVGFTRRALLEFMTAKLHSQIMATAAKLYPLTSGWQTANGNSSRRASK